MIIKNVVFILSFFIIKNLMTPCLLHLEIKKVNFSYLLKEKIKKYKWLIEGETDTKDAFKNYKILLVFEQMLLFKVTCPFVELSVV